MSSFKIDLSTAVVFVAVEPKLKVINKETGEIAVDRETKAKMMTVGLTIADEGEANLYTVSIPETGIPAGVTLGMPVKVVGLKARDWENTFNGEKRFGIAFRAVALRHPVQRQGLIAVSETPWLIWSCSWSPRCWFCGRQRPAWYWMTFGVVFAMVRVSFRYASVMDACGLTVPPSRLRLTLGQDDEPPGPGLPCRRGSCGCGRPVPGWCCG